MIGMEENIMESIMNLFGKETKEIENENSVINFIFNDLPQNINVISDKEGRVLEVTYF